MRKAFLAAVSLVTGLATFYAAAAGPAAAEPARESSASAFGLAAEGLVPISPTIVTQANFPPGEDNANAGPTPSLLTLPLGNLAIAGVIGVEANAHQADDVAPTTTGVPDTPGTSSPVTLAPVNTRALARTTGLGLVFSAPVGNLNPITTALAAIPSLLSVEAVTSEAVAKCVDGQPVFDTGFQVAGLGGLLGVLDPVVQALLDTLLGLLGPGASLSSIIEISPGEVVSLPDGIGIAGLVIRLPLLEEEIVVSYSEVHMAANCTVITAPPTTPARPAGPGGRLASTGGETPFLAIGMGLVALSLVGAGVVRRSRKAATQ